MGLEPQGVCNKRICIRTYVLLGDSRTSQKVSIPARVGLGLVLHQLTADIKPAAMRS